MKNLLIFISSIWHGRSGSAATVQILLGKILIIGVNIITGIITARFLGPEGRGEQAAMILWPQFLAYSMTFGLPSALMYNLKCYPEKKSELFSAALLMGTILGISASIIGIIFMPMWLSQYSPIVIHFAQWFMLAAPLSLLGVIFVAALDAQQEFTVSNRFTYSFPIATLFILLALVLFGKISPFTTGLAYLLPSIPISLWMFTLLLSRIPLVWSSLGWSIRSLASYGVRSYGVDLLGTLSAQIGQALVVGLLTSASMGIYTVAISLSRMLNIVEAAIIKVLFPKTAARPLPEILLLTGRATRLSVFVTCVIAFPLMIVSPWLFMLLYGPEFVGAVSVFRILVLEIILNGMIWVLAQAFMASGRPGIVSILQGIGLSLTVPLMLFLIPSYGLIGAGLSLLGSTIARLFFLLISFPLLLKVPIPNLIITKEDFLFVKAKLF